MNELIFLIYIFVVSTASLIATRLGRDALVGLICVEAVLMNLFVTKQITLFGFTATASDAIAVGTTLSLNLLQEYYTKESAQKAIWISFFCALFYTVISLLHIGYTPAPTDLNSEFFTELLMPTPRIVLASLTVYVFVMHIDAKLYAYFKDMFGDRYFIMRNYGSLAITQLIDTILFTFLGLYGINESFLSLETIASIIFVSYSIKLAVIAIAVPFVRLVRSSRFFRKPTPH